MEMAPKITLPLSVFISYAPAFKDEALRQELEAHLSLLKNLGLITTWHHGKTLAGSNVQQELSEHLETATLILLLISADFLASEACYEEMQVALERNKAGEALVIPVLLRKVHLESTPFKHLQCLPHDSRPVSSWEDPDEAFTTIVAEIRETIEKYPNHQNTRIGDKEKRLRMLIHDHNGFLKDRLESFVGRQQELAEIQNLINQRLPTGGYITITGQAGQGKSSIIAKLVETYGVEQVAYHFIPINPGPDHQMGLLRNVMARLILKYDLSDLYVASDSRAALRDYFPKVLTDVTNQGGQEIIFIDGLDQLEEDFNGVRDLSFLPTDPPSGIVFVLGTRPNDTMKPLELLKPHNEYRLPNLSRQDFDRILQHRDVSLKETVADQFYNIIGENALYLDLVAKELTVSDAIDPLDIITRITANPNNIFTLSIERLKRQGQLWERVIYPVLGVLLTAQEPLALQSLRDLLQVEDYKLRDGITKLGGLLTEDTQRRYSLFHLKLRDYLRQGAEDHQKEYIFSVEEEEGWHVRLALWCERGQLSLIWQDVKDAGAEQRRREYARHHYITHLHMAKERQRLYETLDTKEYGRAKLCFDPSTRAYAQDIYLGQLAASWEGWTLEDGIAFLPRLWQYTLLHCALASRADTYPNGAFRLLVMLERQQEAIGLAELLTDAEKKFCAFCEIALQLREQSVQEVVWQGLLLRADEIAQTISNARQQTRALNALGQAFVEVGQWQDAEQVITRIESPWQQAEALLSLGQALAQAGQCSEAIRVWQDAERVIARIEGVRRQAEALCALVKALAQAGQWQDAERLLVRIKDAWQQAEALCALGQALVQAGECSEATRVWQDAERAIARIEGARRQTDAWRALGQVLAQAGQWQDAERVIARIKDAQRQAEALHAIRQIRTHARKQEDATRVIQNAKQVIAKTWDVNGTLLSLGQIQVQAGQWQDAERAIARIESPWQQAEALLSLGQALAQAGERSEAIRVWQDAERAIARIEDAWQQAEAWRRLGQVFVQAGQWQGAERAIAHIDVRQRAKALSTLGQALVQSRQWRDAERVIAKIQDIREQISALSRLGQALAQAGEQGEATRVWEDAEGVIAHIESTREKVEALYTVGLELAQAERYHDLLRLIQRFWLLAKTRDEALRCFEPATYFIPRYPKLGIALFEGFTWVNSFLTKGDD